MMTEKDQQGEGPEEPVPPQQCPSCIKFYPSGEIIRIKRGPQNLPGPVVFYGCLHCLANIITDWNHFADATCYLCGRRKIDTMFPGGAVRAECPLHANAARLLSQALPLLGDTSADPRRLAKEIKELLG